MHTATVPGRLKIKQGFTRSSCHSRRAQLLPGREREGAVLNDLLDRVRGGHSAAVVVHGEAGVGKTALLNEAFAPAPGLRVVRAAGIESEMELPFAGLQQLCLSMLDQLDHLPPPQAAALRTAFGLSQGPPPDRFLAGLAVLGLLAETARQQPLVGVVDGCQWLDQASAQALAFAARRIQAEGVLLAFAAREPGPDLEAIPGIRWSAPRSTERRRRPTVSGSTRRWRRSAILTWIPIAAPGTGRRRSSAPTRRSRPSSSNRPSGPRGAAVPPPRRCSWTGRSSSAWIRVPGPAGP
jgi:hypothetical protein